MKGEEHCGLMVLSFGEVCSDTTDNQSNVPVYDLFGLLLVLFFNFKEKVLEVFLAEIGTLSSKCH